MDKVLLRINLPGRPPFCRNVSRVQWGSGFRFLSAYDRWHVSQQKCLVHLVRDIDDDLLRNPLDDGVKSHCRKVMNLVAGDYSNCGPLRAQEPPFRKHKRSSISFPPSQWFPTTFISELANKYRNGSRRVAKRCSPSWIMMESHGTTTTQSML